MAASVRAENHDEAPPEYKSRILPLSRYYPKTLSLLRKLNLLRQNQPQQYLNIQHVPRSKHALFGYKTQRFNSNLYRSDDCKLFTDIILFFFRLGTSANFLMKQGFRRQFLFLSSGKENI